MTGRFLGLVRKQIAVGMCCICPLAYLDAQTPATVDSMGPIPVRQDTIDPVRPHAPILWRPYLAPSVPPVRLSDSGRFRQLVRGGKIYLTAQDAIALALENNIDIEVARYNPISLAWSVERSEAGGSLPGVPNGATQASSVASGQGVLGSQQAAGLSSGQSANSRATGNAQITQVGPVAQTLDPALQESSVFSHKTQLLADAVQTGQDPVLLQNQRTYFGSYQQGFPIGGSVSVTYNSHYLDENAITDLTNPSVFPTLAISVQQSLLQGFGKAVNTRQIEVAKINYRTSDLNFKSTLITTIANVLNAYYGLVGDYEDLKAKQSARDAAQTLLEDSRKQVEIGSLSDLDLITSEGQVASTGQDVVTSQTALTQQEIALKNLISRRGLGDPVLAAAEIVPLDQIEIPAADNLPTNRQLVNLALGQRNDLAAEQASIAGSIVSMVGEQNGLLPNVQALGGTSNAGAAGTAKTAVEFGQLVGPNPYFVGGLGTALGQVFRRDFPTENIGAYGVLTLENRAAQADYNIDQLSLRQSELSNVKDRKQAEVDVLNAVVALRQSRAKYDAASRARVLDQQLLDSEQKKFTLGASTPYNIITQQRDLVMAQSTEIAALVAYSEARVNLDQTLGSTLTANHISITDARTGRVAAPSTLPANLPR